MRVLFFYIARSKPENAMIIFNIPAIVVGAIIGLIYWLVSLMVSDTWMETGNHQNLLIFGIGSVVSILTEFLGLKGRLFWLPMWLIALGGTGWFSYQEWGWVGPVGIAGVGLGVFLGLIVLGRVAEKKEWENAPGALADLHRLLDGSGSPKALWETYKKAFFVPAFMKYTMEVCSHNTQVIEILEQNEELSAEEAAQVSAYKNAIAPGLQPLEKPIKVDNELTENVSKIIEARIEFFEKKEEEGAT